MNASHAPQVAPFMCDAKGYAWRSGDQEWYVMRLGTCVTKDIIIYDDEVLRFRIRQ